MRKATTLFFTAVLLLAGCQKGLDREVTERKDTPCLVTVSVGSPATKVVGVKAGDESAVRSLQVFLYDGENLAAAASSDSSCCSVTCYPGEYRSYILVNSPAVDRDSVTSLSSLKNRVLDLADNAPDTLAACAMADVTVTRQATTKEITAERYVSKVVIEKITKAFAGTLRINSVYMTNVVGGMRCFSGDTLDVWYNRMGYSASAADCLVRDTVNAYADTVIETSHNFYVFPNPTVSDTTAKTWCPRHTRLVLDALFREEPCYYVVNMPVLERNRVYRIQDLVIKRKGSDNEEDIAEDEVDIIVGPDLEEWEDVSEEILPVIKVTVSVNVVVDAYSDGGYSENL